MATTDPAKRPYRYQGKITFDVPGVDAPIEAGFGSGGAGKGSTPYGDWPITQFNPHTPKYDLEGFALNNIYGRMPDPLYSDGRSDVMLHLDPKGRKLDQIKSLGCLSVDPKDWPALRDEIISLQKQGYSLVAHVDQSGQVTIRQADGTTATPVSSASAFADATNAVRAPIKDLQTSLAKAGFSPGKIDGIQGPQTTAAVKAFQQANGLKVDGIVGPQTSAVLAASSARGATGSNSSGSPDERMTRGVPNPLPAPAPLTPQSMQKPAPTLGSRLPQQAMYGIDRLTPGQVTKAPTDFTTANVGQPADARLMSLGQPTNQNLTSLGAARTAPAVATTKTIVNPAYVDWQKTYGTGGANSTLQDIHDLRDDATMKAQTSTPNAPPKTIVVSIAPKTITGEAAPSAGGFGAVLGGIGSNLQSLGSNIKTGVQSLGTKAQETGAALGDEVRAGVNTLIPEMLRTVKGRTALIDPMIESKFTSTPGQTGNPTRYGATPEERQAAAARREAMQNGTPMPATTAVATSRSITPSITSSAKATAVPSGGKSVGSGGSASAPNSGQTITGTSTGRQYVVGQTYSNGNGSYVAQSNGTFKKVA